MTAIAKEVTIEMITKTTTTTTTTPQEEEEKKQKKVQEKKINGNVRRSSSCEQHR